MKLDVNVLRYLSKDEFRVLTAVEMGQKNHEIVPLPLIDSISGLKHGGAFKCIKTLLRHKLLHHDGGKNDGYRLTPMGYDFLAIKVLVNRGHISGVGRKIGVGKESDIYEVTNDEGETLALKLHRLGRTSFRAVKAKRDYLGKRKSFSWLYLSRLAALKEYAFMKALGDHGFPVPQAVDNNRHAVLMTMLDAHPLVQVKKLQHPAQVYLTCMELISRLASKGLIHCDFNEFNLLIDDDEEMTVIDFPQMVSVSHPNAREYFDRDVACIQRFFSKKIGYVPEQDPNLPYVTPSFEDAVAEIDEALDVDLAASGFQRQHQKALEEYIAEHGDEEEDGEEEEEEGEDEGEEAAGIRQGAGDEAEPQAGSNGQHTEASTQDAAAQAEGASCSSSGDEDEEDLEDRQGADEAGGSGSEGQEEQEEDQVTFGGRKLPRQPKAPSKAEPLGGRDVQQLLVQQRKKQQRREVLAKVAGSRNTSKAVKRGSKASGGSTAAPTFGGW